MNILILQLQAVLAVIIKGALATVLQIVRLIEALECLRRPTALAGGTAPVSRAPKITGNATPLVEAKRLSPLTTKVLDERGELTGPSAVATLPARRIRTHQDR